jgi:hypothetical protein
MQRSTGKYPHYSKTRSRSEAVPSNRPARCALARRMIAHRENACVAA